MTLFIENDEKFSLLNHSISLSAGVFHDMEEKVTSTIIFIQKEGKRKQIYLTMYWLSLTIICVQILSMLCQVKSFT